MGKRGQGAFEYILLLAGVLLIVVLAIIILRGTLTGAGKGGIDSATCRTALANAPLCYGSSGAWDATRCTGSDTCTWSQTLVDTKCYTDTSTTERSPMYGSAYAAGGVAGGSSLTLLDGGDQFQCTSNAPG